MTADAAESVVNSTSLPLKHSVWASLAPVQRHTNGFDSHLVRASSSPSCTHILPHHSTILVFENVTVIHEGMLPRRRLFKDDENFSCLLDENDIFPTCEMSGGRLAL